MPCPHCASPTTARQPKTTALGYQTFRCAACRRSFNERTGTPFKFLEYPTDIVLLKVTTDILGDFDGSVPLSRELFKAGTPHSVEAHSNHPSRL